MESWEQLHTKTKCKAKTKARQNTWRATAKVFWLCVLALGSFLHNCSLTQKGHWLYPSTVHLTLWPTQWEFYSNPPLETLPNFHFRFWSLSCQHCLLISMQSAGLWSNWVTNDTQWSCWHDVQSRIINMECLNYGQCLQAETNFSVLPDSKLWMVHLTDNFWEGRNDCTELELLWLNVLCKLLLLHFLLPFPYIFAVSCTQMITTLKVAFVLLSTSRSVAIVMPLAWFSILLYLWQPSGIWYCYYYIINEQHRYIQCVQ